jgi:signal transduction histidine kinase
MVCGVATSAHVSSTAKAPWRSRHTVRPWSSALAVEPWLLLLFALTVLAFIASTVLAARQFMAVTGLSEDISSNAMPSVLYLSSLRVGLRELESQLDRAAAHPSPAVPSTPTTVAGIRDAARRYTTTLPFAGEAERWSTAHVAIEETIRAAEAAEALFAAHRPASARAIVEDEFHPASARADADLWDLVDLNVAEAEARARAIESTRTHAVRYSLALDGLVASVSGVLALVAFTVLHRSSRALAEKSSELEQFAGRVAHDLRGPLGTITIVLGQLRRSVGPADPMVRRLDRADEGVCRAEALLDDLLAFASAGGLPKPGARTAVAPAIRVTLDQAADSALETGVELRAEPSDEDAAVACAPGVLSSILSNLVSNAVKYTSDSPVRRVLVRSFRKARLLRIEVADTGPGLPPGASRRIFEPHVRADATGRPGFGLGLATVRRLVLAHGGKLGVVSSASGAVFWVELPPA